MAVGGSFQMSRLSQNTDVMQAITSVAAVEVVALQALLGANWPNQLQKHKLTRTQTLAGLTKATAHLRTAPDQENIPVSSLHTAVHATLRSEQLHMLQFLARRVKILPRPILPVYGEAACSRKYGLQAY